MRERQARALRSDLEQALALHREGRLDDAARAYRRILKTAPAHVDAMQLLGAIEGQQGRLDSALTLLRRAVAIDPGSAVAHNNLGNTLASMHRHAEALSSFERSLQLKPDNPKALRNQGNALRKLHRMPEALASVDRALALQPGYAEALVTRGELLQEMGRNDEAIDCFRTALAAGKDVDTLHYVLASLGAEPPPERAPAEYVKGLFDQYAASFDRHLVGVLEYRTPQQLADLLQPLLPAGPLDVVDLGCGTGLCSGFLRPVARRLVGVDIAPAMVEQARSTGRYDELAAAELVDWLGRTDERFDLAVAADVLNYLGALDGVLAGLRRVLRPGALVAFSVEKHEGEGFVLRPSRRYAHSPTHLEVLASAQGFTIVATREEVLRKDNDQPVLGLLMVLRVPGPGAA